jgi:tetratricopeptide (TPR) repeat protein
VRSQPIARSGSSANVAAHIDAIRMNIAKFINYLTKGLLENRPARGCAGGVAVALLVLAGTGKSQGAENSAAGAGPGSTEGPNLQQILGICGQIQDQLQAAHLAIERNRQEARAVAAQNADVLSKGLEALQEASSAQRAREFEAMQSSAQAMQKSNRAMLLLAGAFAGSGFLALLIMTYFQWRTANCLAAVSALLPPNRGLGQDSGMAALDAGDSGLETEQANTRLLGAIEHLDRHIDEFKGMMNPGTNGEAASGTNGASEPIITEPPPGNGTGRIAELLSRANSTMNLDQEAALACFEEVLTLEPNNAEALVKKGALLERQDKLNEAVECYDRAISADGSLTVAYLYKGGLCNRLERFKEALECYEKALHTHEQRAG